MKSPLVDWMDVEFDVILQEGDSGYWIASVPSLDGCFSQGRSRAEALANVKEAIALALETETPRRTHIEHVAIT